MKLIIIGQFCMQHIWAALVTISHLLILCRLACYLWDILEQLYNIKSQHNNN